MSQTESLKKQNLESSEVAEDTPQQQQQQLQMAEEEKMLVDEPPQTGGDLTGEPLPEEDCKENSPQKSAHIKALSDRHATVKADLQRAVTELAEKEALVKDLEEDAVRQRERTWLLEERIRLMTEKLCCLKRCLERQEKKQESILMERADVKWEIQECKQFVEKMKSDYLQMKSKKKKHQEDLAALSGQREDSNRSRKELQQDIIRLTDFKMKLQRRDSSVCAVLNGTKMKELEQKKRAIRDAINERGLRSDAIYVTVDEKEERVQHLKQSLENSKKQHQEMLRDRQNHLSYLAETELRLQRSLEYLRSKIDYGTYVPAPWPNLRESLRFKI